MTAQKPSILKAEEGKNAVEEKKYILNVNNMNSSRRSADEYLRLLDERAENRRIVSGSILLVLFYMFIFTSIFFVCDKFSSNAANNISNALQNAKEITETQPVEVIYDCEYMDDEVEEEEKEVEAGAVEESSDILDWFKAYGNRYPELFSDDFENTDEIEIEIEFDCMVIETDENSGASVMDCGQEDMQFIRSLIMAEDLTADVDSRQDFISNMWTNIVKMLTVNKINRFEMTMAQDANAKSAQTLDIPWNPVETN